MLEGEQDIESSLQILLSTALGERIMQPKYGCNMDDMVFENLDTTLKTEIKNRMQTAILYYEPRIEHHSPEVGHADRTRVCNSPTHLQSACDHCVAMTKCE